MAAKRSKLTLMDVRLLFRNFEGKEGMYNKEGDRFFHVALDEELGLELEAEGWNVKWLNSRDDEPPLGHIQCALNFHPDRRPPKVVLITSRGKKQLDLETLMLADMVDIESADVLIGASHWENPNIGKGKGIKAYANEVFITVRESELDLKYADVPEIEMGHAQEPLQLEEGRYEDLGER